MNRPTSDAVFSGSVSSFYQQHLVPLIFEPYAVDLARRVAARAPKAVLELAAGTGVVTRHLAATLPAGVRIVATDLNAPMLETAQQVGTARPVEWRTADALALPFADSEFDVVACQFGVMFFDRARAFAEARRVLRRGGALVFNVWDRIEENEFADVVIAAMATMFPNDPPRFLARTPHGHHDVAAIAADLRAGGFAAPPKVETLAMRSRADSAQVPALAYCQGTPLRAEIEARGPGRLGDATARATEALAQRFGPGAVDGKIQAHVFEVVAA